MAVSMKLPRLLTVILHYGKIELTSRVHEDLKPGASDNNLIVLDNAAPEPYPGAQRLQENVFWGGALEKALDMAENGGFSHLWFCNNDIRFVSAGPHIPKVCGRIMQAEKILGREVGVYSPSATANPYHAHMIRREGRDFAEAAHVDGIAPVFSLHCLERIGGLDMGDNARGYGLDAWVSLRAGRAGFAVVVDHRVTLRHIYHTTAKSIPGFMDEAARDEDAFMRERLGPDWRERLKIVNEKL